MLSALTDEKGNLQDGTGNGGANFESKHPGPDQASIVMVIGGLVTY
jgi:hypothetical protein